tara:strand:+ start:37 stop:1998 length:1962 start_codon:yes stop_codon:yes gene_type:complete
MTLQHRKTELPMQLREASIVPATVNEELRTVDIVFTTGAAIRRYDWWDDEVYEESLSLDTGHVRMERMQSGNAPVLRDHKNSVDFQDGIVVTASVDGKEGRATIRLDGGDEQSDRIWRKIANGIIRNISVGYTVYKYEITREEGKLPVYRAIDWEPMEVSLVAVPADFGASIRDGGKSALVEVVDLARCAEGEEEGNMTMKTGQQAQERNAPADDKNTINPVNQVDVDLVRTQSVTDERKRVSDIYAIAERHADLGDDFARKHIDAGTSIDQVRDAALESLSNKDETTEVRTSVKLGESHEEPAKVRAALINALGNSMAPDVVKIEGMGEKYRGYTPLAIAEECMTMQGKKPESRNRDYMARAALHSTSDFPLLLADTANMVLQQAYRLAEPTYRRIAARKNFNDFRPHSFLTAGDFPALEKLKESGEVKAGTISENKETVSLDTYAKKIGVTRQMLINDHLGAFANFPTMAARRIAAQENAILYGILALNSGAGPKMSDGKNMFHGDHGNLGTAAAISVASLGLARARLRKQSSLDGLKLNLTAKILLCGPDKETEAEQIMASILAAESGKVNPFSGKLTVVSDAEVAGTKWYTLAEPGEAETLCYGYLNGREGPMMAAREGWDFDGAEFRVIHDFAAGATDYRGGDYNPGS